MKYFLSFNTKNIRQRILQAALRDALNGLGWTEYRVENEADIVIVWGMYYAHEFMLQRCRQQNKPFIMFDLAYWNRGDSRSWKSCYYKISLNGLHPTQYLDQGYGEFGRYRKSGGMNIRPWLKNDTYVLIAGMGPKGSKMYRYSHGEWDRKAIQEIQSVSSRPIIYRPKPSDKQPPLINSVTRDNHKLSIARHFNNAYAIVTHHGNAALEALQFGIPAFCVDGPATKIANTDLKDIESPLYSDEREIFFEKLSWWQWHYEEICGGEPFKHLMKKGLI